MRGLALTLLPAAAWLTGTLQMFSQIADAISDWAIHLVFSPKVWLGVILAACSVGLFLLSGALRKRGQGGATGGQADGKAGDAGQRAKALPAAKQESGPLADDDLDDEIAAILKRRGIS